MVEVAERRLRLVSQVATGSERPAAATGQLAVTEDVCRDILWSLTDGVLWHRLVLERGWSDQQFAAHLAQLWIAALTVAPRH